MSKQYHSFHNINLRENNKDQQHQQNVYCPFNVKKIEFDFAYNTLSSNGLPIITARADICNNEVVGVFNRYAGSSVLSAEITPADFNAARISNFGYVESKNAINVDLIPGVAGPFFQVGAFAQVNINDFNTAEVKTTNPVSCNNNINVTINPPVLQTGFFQPFILITRAYITPAQLLAAGIDPVNNPLTSINDIQVTIEDLLGNVYIGNAQITSADFDASAIANTPEITDMNNPPVNITLNNVFNTVNTSIPGNIRAYITPPQFTAATIDSTNNPLLVAGPISCTLDGNALTLQVTQAEFNAAGIANTNNPLTLPAAMEVKINGNATVNTLMTMDGLSKDKVIDYYYKDPIRVTTINYRFSVSPCVLIGADILCHVTCYG